MRRGGGLGPGRADRLDAARVSLAAKCHGEGDDLEEVCGNVSAKELSLKQNLLWNTIGCLVYQGCMWLTTVLVVLLSSSYENSGILAFAMAIGNISTALSTYNVRTFQVSDIKGQFTSENYVGFRVVTVMGGTLACAVYSFIVSPGISTSVAMVAYLVFKADESFVNVLYGIDQKASRMDYIGISQGARGILAIAAFSASLVLLNDLTVAFVAMFAVCLAVTLLYDLPRSRRLDSVRASINRVVCLDLLRICAPNVVATVCYGFVATIARQWFGLSYGEDALGIYAAVATPCVLVQVMANYLYNPFLVPIARSWTARDGDALRSQLSKLGIGMVAAIVVCIAAAAMFGAPAIELVYGESISSYSWLVVPAMVAASLMAVACFLTDLLIVMRSFRLAVLINLVALVVCAIATYPLITTFYMNGVNIAIIVSFIAGICVAVAGMSLSSSREKRGFWK